MNGSIDSTARAPRARKPLATRLPPHAARGAIAYRWDLSEDRLIWGRGAARFFGVPSMTRLKSGRAFAARQLGSPATSRAHAILFTNETDEGFGVPYRTVYGFARANGSTLWVEDTGRWFAGRDGRPTRAEGIVREAAEPAPLLPGSTESDFLALLARDFANLRNEPASPSALLAFAFSDPAMSPDPDLLRHLRRQSRIGDRVGLVGRMLILLARACPPDRAPDAAARLAADLSREAGHTLNATSLQIPHDATHVLDAIDRAERQLALADIGTIDPLTQALQALNARMVTMALEPIAAAQSRTVSFYEALARFPDGEGGFASTQELVAALEAHGSITLLDHRILSLAIDALEDEPDLTASVNVAPRSLADPDWFRYAEVRLSRRPDLAQRLILEITEEADLAILAYARPAMESLSGWGVGWAIDDFGMGRTSLRHLSSLRTGIIKIAGPFIQNLSHSIDDRQFVGAMIDLAHQRGLKTVAEWVEDEATAAYLEQRGIDFLQGRLIGTAHLRQPRAEPRPRQALAV